MNTVQTVQAWLQLAPSLIALIAALESLFPKRTGPAKLEAFHQAISAAVAQTVAKPDGLTLRTLNTAYANEKIAALNANAPNASAPDSAQTVQEIA